MIRVYFDTNIFEDIVKREIDININELNNFTNIAYYISTAHVEEYFIAIKNDSANRYIQYNTERKLLMTSLKVKGILNPSNTRIINKPEKFDDCLERVKQYDTTDIMVQSGGTTYQEQSNFFKDLLLANPDVQNNSNLSPKEIWDKDEVKCELTKFPDYVEKQNVSVFPGLKYVYGTRKALKLALSKIIVPFEIKKGCFEEISNQYSRMEIIFEFLHSILNKCGYNRDKKAATVISGIYDTTHSIYGTYCDYFVSSDARLRKRISAIYYYLGVPTKVITFNDFMNIADTTK